MTAKLPVFLIDPTDMERAEIGRTRTYLHQELDARRLWHGWDERRLEDFMMRSMEIAVRSAAHASHVRELPRHAQDWETAEKVADKAQRSITVLMHYMAYGTKKGDGMVAPEALQFNLRQIRRIETPDVHVDQQTQEAAEMAEAIASGLAAITRVKAASRAMKRRVSASVGNVGEVERAAFAKVWGEAWLSLYNKRPSSSRGDDNAFAAFLELAWEDACGESETPFQSVLGKALKHLGQPGKTIPPKPPWYM